MSKATAADPKPGHNQPPDWAKIVTDQMAIDYANLETSVTALLLNAKSMPLEVLTPEDSEKVSLAVKALRDESVRAESYRETEKQEYLRKGQAVDQFFKAKQARLDKGADILHARVHVYNEKRRIAEETRRRQEYEAAQAIEREAARKLNEERRLADEAAAAAARARKPENIETHQQMAEQHADNAESARVDTLMATAAADEARNATMQKPAEMVRERFDSGVLNTMAKEGYVEITDADQIPLDVLRPYFKDEHLLYALKGYAKKTSYKKPLAGAIIEMRNKTVIK